MNPVMSRRKLLVMAGGTALAAACRQTDTAAEPVWGKEPCAHCKMLVSDKRYAAQVVDETGEHRFFDDIGCMVLWMESHKMPERAWARADASGVWLDARTAKYARGARTPMDFGFEIGDANGLGFNAVRDAVLAKKGSRR